MAPEGLVFPQSYYGEVEWLPSFLKHIEPLLHASLVYETGPTASLALYFQKKRREFRDDPNLFPGYLSEAEGVALRTHVLWLPRTKRSASSDITRAWKRELTTPQGIWQTVLENQSTMGQNRAISKLESQIESVPERLEGRAFLYRFARELLPFDLGAKESTEIELMVSREFLLSYMDDSDSFILVDTPFGPLDCGIKRLDKSGRQQTLSWRVAADFLESVELRTLVEDQLSLKELIELRTVPAWQHLVECALESAGTARKTLRRLHSSGRLADIPPLWRSGTAFLAVYDRICMLSEALHGEGFIWAENAGEGATLRRARSTVGAARTEQLLLPDRSMQTIDLGFVIALKEEFKLFHALLSSPTVVRDTATGTFYYRFTSKLKSGRELQCVASFVGRMGNTGAALHTARLITSWRPRLVVNIGIAGSIDPDLHIGDVVAASQVDMYMVRSKIESAVDADRLDWRLAGEVFPSTAELTHAADNLEFARSDLFQQWQSAAVNELRESSPLAAEALENLRGPRNELTLQVGHIASGPTVIASDALKQRLLERDRSFLAVEMESGGVLRAVYEEIRRPGTLILKGISDYADDRKKQLDSIERGALRKLAMRSAVEFLWSMADAGYLSEITVS